MREFNRKKCLTCRENLSLDLFKQSTRTIDGFQVNCIECADAKRLKVKSDYQNRPQVLQRNADRNVKRELERQYEGRSDIKRCELCWEWIDISKFKSSKRIGDGFQIYCISCADKRTNEQKRKYATDTTYRESKLKYAAEKWKTDSAYRERQNQAAREPAYREAQRNKQRARYREDQQYADEIREKNRERAQNDPNYQEQQLQYRKSPSGQDSRRRAVRKMRSKPGYVEEELRKAREKYASDETEKEKQKAKVRAYKNKRYKNDPMFRLNRSMSGGMGRSLKGKKGGVSWLALVDYALQELREHLEFQFEDGMTWENYGSWHIDHRKPISWFSFETPDDEQFKDCWALSNLKPMWGEDNLKKSNRYAD